MRNQLLLLTALLFSSTLFAQGLNDNLIAHFPLNNSAEDLVSSADGTITNATPSEDRHSILNGAYYFDGTSNINMGDSSLFEMGLNDYSISVWFKSYNKSSYYTYVVGKRGWNDLNSTSKDKVYALALDRNNKLLFYYKFDDYSGGTFPTSVALDTNWHHAVVTVGRSDSIKLYIDKVMVSGTSIASKSAVTMNCENGDFMLGNCSQRNEPLNGMIDDVRVYKGRALTKQEIKDAFDEKYTDIKVVSSNLTYKLYPNPTKNILTLALTGKSNNEIYSYKIHSINSAILSNETITSNMQNIDVSTYASGFYYISFFGQLGNKIGQHKFIKE